MALELRNSSPMDVGDSIERISEVGARPVLVEAADVKEIILEDVRVLESKEEEKKTSRKGSGSEEVRAMQDGSNGQPVASLSEITGIKKAVRKGSGDAEVDVSLHRVFLLGENRWEDPSRLIGSDKLFKGSKVMSPTKCLTCYGEGQVLCTECDGGGEANIEPQFMEWIDDEAKCPYCAGVGYTICEVCEGNITTAAQII